MVIVKRQHQSGLIFPIIPGVLYIIPYRTALFAAVLFAAEEGVDIKTGRETDVAVLSSFFLIEGAHREKLSPAGLSLK